MDLTPALVGALPKVALHDHLDGGLRAATVLELSRELELDVPWEGEADAVAEWFRSAADSGSLPAYLSTFDRTVALMQSAGSLRRIAREFVEDMVADGVVYAETRWAPHQHSEGGLSLEQAVQAVQDGLDQGVADAAASGKRIVVGQLLCYLRHLEPTDDLVEIAAERRDRGVLGLDLAGPEAGFPASRFRAQFARARELGLRVTIHAGEADGPSSIADALDCGAERIGHGARVIDDVREEPATPSAAEPATTRPGAMTPTEADPAEADPTAAEPAPVEPAAADAASAVPAPAEPWTADFGPLAQRVHAERVCLEMCPSSNLQTGVAESVADHPVLPLHRLGFTLAISSDNRLMSRTSTSREMLLAAEAGSWTLEDLEQLVLAGLGAGFAPEAERRALREEIVEPAFAALRGTSPIT